MTAVVSLTIASTALEQRSVSASAIFKFPLEAMARKCAIAKLALAVFGGVATTTVVSTHQSCCAGAEAVFSAFRSAAPARHK